MLIINGNLIFPPSEVSCFRDITLYTHIYTNLPVLVQIESQHVDACYSYMRQTGSFDYVQDIITPDQETGMLLSDDAPCDIRARKFWAGNMQRIVQQIRDMSIKFNQQNPWNL